MKVVDFALEDGRYDAFVVWAETRENTDQISLDLTITTGAHKGEVVSLRATGIANDAFALIGTPCILLVDQGKPRVVW